MNFKKLFFMLTFVVLFATTAFAQTTYYVDATNGLPGNNGLAATQTAVGVGPVESLTTLFVKYPALADGSTINIAVGTYPETGALYTFANTLTLNGYVPVGSASTEVIFPNGIELNGASKTLTLTLGGIGSAGPTAATRFNVGTQLDLTLGTITVGTPSALYIASGVTITRTRGALNGTPTFATSGNFNLVYASPGINGTMTAGSEVPANFGAGFLDIQRNQFENLFFPSSLGTLTFALNTGAAAIDVTGNADVTFSNNISLTRNSILDNSGGGNLTINGNVSFPDPAANGVTPARISMSGAGTLEINGNVTFNYRDVNGGNAIESTGGGALVINGNVSFAKTTSGGADRTATIRETGGGSLDINGTVTYTTATISSTVYHVLVNLVNDSGGSVSLGSTSGTSTLRGTLSNNAGASTFTLNGNLDLTASLAGATTGLNNAGDIVLNGFTLNLAFSINTQTLTITNGGEISGTGILKYSVANGTGAGTVNFTGNGDFGNYTVASNHIHTFTGSPTFNAVSLPQGDMRLATAQVATVEGLFTFTGGTLVTVGTGTFDFKNGFSRTAGTYTSNTGLFKFSGANNQTFSPGANLALYDLEFASTGTAVVTLNQSVIVNNDLTISDGSVNLSSYNIRMQTGNPNTVINNAEYTSSGGGSIIFEGTTGVIQGTGVFSNFEVNVTAGNAVTLGSNITVSGVITLREGDLVVDDVAAEHLTLNSTLVRPTIRINTNPGGSATIIDNNASANATNDITVAAGTYYNILYFGDLAGPYVIAGLEWIPAQLYDVTIQTSANTTVQIPAAAVTVRGTVYVEAGETFDLNAQTLTAMGNNVSHSIFGTVANGNFKITGNTVTLNGDDDTPGENTFDSVEINPTTAAGSNITFNYIYALTGNLNHVKGNATLNMGSAADDVDDITNKKVVGTFTVSGGVLTLGSWIEVGSGGANAFTHNGGVIALGDNRLIYNPGLAATYAVSNTASYTYNSTGGRVRFDGNNGSLITNPSSSGGVLPIPNVQVNGNLTISGDSEVSNVLIHSGGTLNIANGITLTFSGTNWYEYGAGPSVNGAGAGVLVFASTSSLGTDGGYTIKFWNINPGVDNTVTVSSIAGATLASSTTARTLTVGNTLTMQSGTLALGRNDVATTNFTRTAGSITGDAGVSSTTAANTHGVNRGELVVGGGNFTPGAGLIVPNMRINGAVTVVGNNNFTVSGFFQFGSGGNVTYGANNNLVLGNGATIIRDNNATLGKAPVFGTSVNYYYLNDSNADYNTGVELTSDASIINNFTFNMRGVMSGIDASANTGHVALAGNKAITVNGTLSLMTGTFKLASNASTSLTLGEGATLARSGDADFDITTGGGLTGTNNRIVRPASGYNLRYFSVTGTGTTQSFTTAREWPSNAVINNLTVAVGDADFGTDVSVVLHANRTVTNFDLQATTASSGIGIGDDGAVLGAKTLTVNGTTTITSGIVSTSEDGAGNTELGVLVVKGSLNSTGGTIGFNGDDDGDALLDGGLNLTFNGSVAQDIVLSGNTTIPTLTLNSTGATAADATINVSGGNLTITNLLVFENGILNMGTRTLFLPRPQLSANGGLAFDRSGVDDGEFGHVVGKISRPGVTGEGNGTNGRFEFPTGTLSGEYRPAAMTFTPSYPMGNPVSIVVSHVDASPEGTLNLPLEGGNGVKVGSYPNFYWLVSTTPTSLTSTQQFDLDLQANNIGVPYTSDQDLRIIRRQDGSSTSNGWAMQGTAANYQNYQVVNLVDTVVVARTVSGQGGLVAQGSRFAIGVPARVPQFTAPVANTFTVAEGATADNTVQFTAVPLNANETIAYSKVSGPDWAAVSTAGLLTLTPGYDAYSTTPYAVVVRATATPGGLFADYTLNVTVTNTNRAPSFTATGAAVQATASVANGVLYTFTYKAIDADGDAIAYSVAVDPTPSVMPTIAPALGTLTFTPGFADAGKVFTLTVTATDGTLTATTTTALTVTYAAILGDVTGDGSVGADDAAKILEYVVGKITLTDEQKYAADVNADGQVGALDAAWILYKVVNGSFPTAKMSAAMGSVEIGQLQKEAEGYLLPINLAQTTGVLSVYAELDVDANIEVLGVTGRLPQGWISSSKVENGKVMFAFAGLEPLKEGSIAYISLRLKDKEANATIFGNANLNDGYSAALNSVTVREIPSEFVLSQNYPNPFNPTTSIKFAIPENANVTLDIYNMLGQKVKTLLNGMQDAGYYTVNWDGSNDLGSKVSSGIYIYRISAGKYNATMKMNLLK